MAEIIKYIRQNKKVNISLTMFETETLKNFFGKRKVITHCRRQQNPFEKILQTFKYIV